MKASEILRKLADVIDGRSGSGSGAEVPHQTNSPELTAFDPRHGEGSEINTQSMVSPLQQKLDLMKRLAGDSDQPEPACDACGHSPCACEPQQSGGDELAIMKQNAGIAPVVMAIADEDEPFEG